MIKITQVRDGGNHVTQSTLTLDAWVERMKEEVKTCPVTMFRSQLRVTRNFAASLFRNIKYFTLRKLYLCRKWMQKRLQKTTTTGITLPNFDFLA